MTERIRHHLRLCPKREDRHNDGTAEYNAAANFRLRRTGSGAPPVPVCTSQHRPARSAPFGLLKLLYNSVDEAMAGYCTHIKVTDPEKEINFRSPWKTMAAASPSKSIRRPVNPRWKPSMTVLHAGAKFGGKAYTVSGGLPRRSGLPCVNALSTWVKVWVKRNDKLYFQNTIRASPRWMSLWPASPKAPVTTTAFLADPRKFSAR